jgi:mevalonate kinase
VSPEKSASATAHGKVILLGEHAVVYGVPALAAGIERGARATAARAAAGERSTLTLLERTIAADPASSDDLARAFAALLGPGAEAATSVVAASDLPPGGGLGSSAALGVAIARAVERLAGGRDAAAIEAAALARAAAWERVFHGNPSGIDTATAARGGCLRFVRGAGATPIALARELWLCVGWSGASSSTRAMVDRVARLRQDEPARVERSLEAIARLVEDALGALASGDLATLGDRMTRNHELLAALSVSNEVLDRLCALALGAGALGAKLTGAGGGGSVVALVAAADAPEHGDARDPRAARAVLDAWKRAGFDGFATRVRRATEADR